MKAGNTRNTLRLSVDVVNLMNLFNSHWGVAWSPNQTVSDGNNQIKLLNYEYTDNEIYYTITGGEFHSTAPMKRLGTGTAPAPISWKMMSWS